MPGFPQVSGVGVPAWSSPCVRLPTTAAAAGTSAETSSWSAGSSARISFTSAAISRSTRAGARVRTVRCGALLRVGSTLYVGGNYMRRIAGEKWPGIAAFDTATGGIATWNPKVLWGGGPAVVDELAENRSGSVIYASGSFDTSRREIPHRLRGCPCELRPRDGLRSQPRRRLSPGQRGQIAVTDTRVYTWGNYVEIGGQKAHWSLAALDPRSGKLVAWEPALDGAGSASAASVIGDRVIIGGFFTRLDGQPGFVSARFRTHGRRRHLGTEDWGSEDDVDVSAVATSGDILFATSNPLPDRELKPRTLVGYDLDNGRVVWRSAPRFDGVGPMAASATMLVLGARGIQ